MKEASARCVRSSFLWAAETGACWGTGRQCEVGSPGEKQAEGVPWFPSITVGGWPGGTEPLLALVCARLGEIRWMVADAFSKTCRCVLECGRQGAVCWASERVLRCPCMYTHTHTHMYMVCASECWDQETASSWPLCSPPSTVPAHSNHAVNTCWSSTCGMATWLYQTDHLQAGFWCLLLSSLRPASHPAPPSPHSVLMGQTESRALSQQLVLLYFYFLEEFCSQYSPRGAHTPSGLFWWGGECRGALWKGGKGGGGFSLCHFYLPPQTHWPWMAGSQSPTLCEEHNLSSSKAGGWGPLTGSSNLSRCCGEPTAVCCALPQRQPALCFTATGLLSCPGAWAF